MKKHRTILVGLLLVLMIAGFSLNTPAQNNSEKEAEIPEIFQLNASMDFDKKAINEWVKEHSWKQAYSLATDSHTKRTAEGFRPTMVTLYTPLFTWVEANYYGERNSREKDRIQETYQSRVVDPDEQAYFIFQLATTKRSALDMENFLFVLEDEKGRQWETGEAGYASLRENIKSESFMGTEFYAGTVDLRFYFSEDKKPSWDQLTLSVVRANKDGKKEFTWDFE